MRSQESKSAFKKSMFGAVSVWEHHIKKVTPKIDFFKRFLRSQGFQKVFIKNLFKIFCLRGFRRSLCNTYHMIPYTIFMMASSMTWKTSMTGRPRFPKDPRTVPKVKQKKMIPNVLVPERYATILAPSTYLV